MTYSPEPYDPYVDDVTAEANADYEAWRCGFPGPPYTVPASREPELVGDALNTFLESFYAKADAEADRFETTNQNTTK